MAKEYQIAFKLGAGLDSSFSRSFSTASEDFKKLQKQVKDLDRGNGKSNSTKPLRDDLKRTQDEMKKTGSVAGKMRGMIKQSLLPLTAGLGAGVLIASSFKKSVDFEAQLDSIQAISGETDTAMKKIHDLALKEGARTKYSALEAAQGMEEMIKAGLTTTQVIDGGLAAALNMAAAGEIGLADSAEIMSTALNAFKKDGLEAATVADILAGNANASATGVMDLKLSLSQAAAVASGVGLTFRDTNIALGLFANNGLKGSDAGTSLKTMLMRLQPKTDEAYNEFVKLGLMTLDSAKAMEYLSKVGVKPASDSVQDITAALAGYMAKADGAKSVTGKYFKKAKEMITANGWVYSSFYDATGSLKDMEEIAGTLNKQLSGLNDMQRQAALDTIFGSDAIRAANILYEEGANGVQKFNDEMSKVTALDVAKKRMDNAKGAIEQFSGAMETLQISILEPTLPLIKELALKAADASEQFQAWMNTRQAKEWGNTILAVLKAAPKLIGMTASAMAAVKVGKGISATANFVKGIGKVGEAGSAAAKGVKLLGGAATFLTNPLGLAVAGVGALTLGVIAYNRHQEKTRQALIHMGDDLKKAYGDYTAVETQTQKTRDLVAEYERLKTKIADSKTPASELVEAKRKLAEAEQTLIDMYPDIITQHDIENGKLREKAGLIDRISQSDLESAKIKLEKEIADKSGSKGKLEDEIGSLSKKKETETVEKDKYIGASVAMKELENEYTKLQMSNIDQLSKEWETKIVDIVRRANDIGQQVGMSFSHIGLIEGSSQELFDEYKETLDSLDKTSDELKTAQDSYQELYNAQKKWIELSNGGDIEEQARRYKTMTDEQKHQFDEALKKLAELNLEMNMLPLEKRINIDVVKRTAGIAVPSTVPTMGKSVAMPYADGGLINKPHVGLVGEAGPEAIIPLSGSRRKRALGLYQTVGRALGVREYANGGMVNMASATRSPVINSSGGHSTQPIMIENKPTVVVKGDASEGTIKLIEQAMQRVNDDFGRKLEAYLRQKGRVSMSGV